MMRRLEFHPDAEVDADEAVRWYASQSTVAALSFIEELEHALAAIQSAPERWPEHTHGTRRYLMRRYPFLVIYRADGPRIEIVAVAHAKRRPQYWKHRLE